MTASICRNQLVTWFQLALFWSTNSRPPTLVRGVACSRRRPVANLSHLDLHRHPHLEVLTRARKLRENVTAYRAVYAALAEALDPPPVMCDRLLASTSGHRATIEVMPEHCAQQKGRIEGRQCGAEGR